MSVIRIPTEQVQSEFQLLETRIRLNNGHFSVKHSGGWKSELKKTIAIPLVNALKVRNQIFWFSNVV